MRSYILFQVKFLQERASQPAKILACQRWLGSSFEYDPLCPSPRRCFANGPTHDSSTESSSRNRQHIRLDRVPSERDFSPIDELSQITS